MVTTQARPVEAMVVVTTRDFRFYSDRDWARVVSSNWHVESDTLNRRELHQFDRRRLFRNWVEIGVLKK